MAVPTLLLSGTCGVGKSTIAAEINDALADAGISNAAIDLDAFTWQWPPSSPFNTDLMFENLTAVWPNYRAHGASRLVLARVLEHASELSRYREAIPGAELVVCRLVAPQQTRITRLRERMPAGPSREWHERRSVELEAILEQSGVEDFVVANDRTPREVALDVLQRAAWL
jgi:adenylylsulfate kinase-like enzyme